MDRSVFALTLYIELNLFAFAIMMVLLLFTKSKKNRLLLDQKLFVTMVVSNASLLILDTAMVLLDGVQGQSFRMLFYASTFLYYVFNTLICLFWYLYIHYYIYRNKSMLKKQIPFISIPFIIVFILSVLSLFGNFAFDIDSANVYHRGKYFFVMTIVCLCML
ncbi:MAG: hypothetical protein WC332_06735, partial [Clostridia bacterium]